VAGDLQVEQMEGEDLFQGILGFEDVAGVGGEDEAFA